MKRVARRDGMKTIYSALEISLERHVLTKPTAQAARSPVLNLPCLVSPRFTQFKMLSFFTLFSSFIFGRQQPQIQPDSSSGVDVARYREPWISHDPNTRTEFLPLLCKVTAYPSSGGIVLGYFSAVELAHLNLSRTKPATRSSDPAEEDDLALRMLRLGAHW